MQHSVCMVSLSVSKLVLIYLISITVGVEFNGAYYRDMPLAQNLLLTMPEICAVIFTYQQCTAPAHRAWETINLLERQTPVFISSYLWPPNSTNLNRLDHKRWEEMQQQIYQVYDVDEHKQRLIEVWHGFAQCHQWRSWWVAQTFMCGYLYEKKKKRKVGAFNLTPYNASVILRTILVNFVNNKHELLCYVQ